MINMPSLPPVVLHDVTVLKPVRTPDGQGGWTHSFQPSVMVRGNVQPLSAGRQQREVRLADRSSVLVTHRGFLPGGTDVHVEDRLAAHGREYRVIAPMDAGGLGQYLVVDLVEVS